MATITTKGNIFIFWIIKLNKQAKLLVYWQRKNYKQKQKKPTFAKANYLKSKKGKENKYAPDITNSYVYCLKWPLAPVGAH